MAELGVELIVANSPQAKGRVERMNGTLQDRLVKELRLRGVKDMASANAVLDGSFLKEFNKRFRVWAEVKTDAHRKAGSRTKLDEVFCEREERAVGRDWCVQWRGRLLPVDAAYAGRDLSRPGRRVSVIEKAGGELLVRYEGKALRWPEVSRRPERAKAKKAVTNNKRYVPSDSPPVQAVAGVRAPPDRPRRLRLRGPNPGSMGRGQF